MTAQAVTNSFCQFVRLRSALGETHYGADLIADLGVGFGDDRRLDEDTDWTCAGLLAAGVPADVVALVDTVTKRPGVPYEDVGTTGPESVDYPDYAHRVAEAVEKGRYARGIVVCGTGLGVSMAANRHPGVRAAVAYDEETARLSREHQARSRESLRA